MFRKIWVVLVVALAGCASAGTQVNQQTVAQFQQGKTTYSEVVAALGAPNLDSMNADSTRVIVYSYAQVSARPETFIPIVGPLVGGADSKGETYGFKFDPRGILVGVTKGNSQASATLFGAHSTATSTATSDAGVAASQAPNQPQAATGAAPKSPQRQCTQAEAAQKRIAIENGYSMVPNCE